MGQKIGILPIQKPEIVLYGYYCPACALIHELSFEKAVERFLWNQNLECPYVNFSLKQKVLKKSHDRDGKIIEVNCHLSIVEGNLVYFMDSSHHLAGTIEPMLDWTEH